MTEFGDAIGVGEFYESIYNMTPAHMDEVHAAIIENPDLRSSHRMAASGAKPIR